MPSPDCPETLAITEASVSEYRQLLLATGSGREAAIPVDWLLWAGYPLKGVPHPREGWTRVIRSVEAVFHAPLHRGESVSVERGPGDRTGRYWVVYSRMSDGEIVARAWVETVEVQTTAWTADQDPATADAAPVVRADFWRPEVPESAASAWRDSVDPRYASGEAVPTTTATVLNGIYRFCLLARDHAQRHPERTLPQRIKLVYHKKMTSGEPLSWQRSPAPAEFTWDHSELWDGFGVDGSVTENGWLQWGQAPAPDRARPCPASWENPVLERGDLADQNAVAAGAERLSWREVASRRDDWGNQFRRLGVGSGAVVAVMLGRTADAWIAPLALAEIGATYFPVSVEETRSRLAEAWSEARPDLVIVEAPTLPRLPPAPAPVVTPPPWSRTAPPAGSVRFSLGDYLMMTSGSTGKPRLAWISRAWLASYLGALAERLPVSRSDRFLHTATFAFSASIRQSFLPLYLGAPLVLATEEERRLASALARRMESAQVTVWDTVPSVWRRCREAALPVGSLRLVLLTGEVLREAEVLHWQAERTTAAVWNLYSSTETAGTVAAGEVVPSAAADAVAAVGTALSDVEIRVLGPDGASLPVGEVGEIVVSGSRYQATSPENALAQSTGDFGWLDAQGVLRVEGRKDRLAKIRGQRVSLDQVEAGFRQLPEVADAAVMAEIDATGEARLVAWVVPKPEAQATAVSLLESMRESWPARFLPREIHLTPSLPRTASGKVARAALPTLVTAPARAHEPATGLEQTIREIWQTLLGRPVPAGAQFRDLGGDSLSAMEFFAALEKRWGSPLPASAYAELTTAEELAARLQATASEPPAPAPSGEDASLIPVARAAAGRPGERPSQQSLMVRVTGAAQSQPLFFCANSLAECHALAESMPPEIAVWFVDSGYRRLSNRRDEIEALARHHVEDLLRVVPSGPVRLLGYSYACQLATEMAVQLRARGIQVDWLGWLDSRHAQTAPFRQYRWVERNVDAFVNDWRRPQPSGQSTLIKAVGDLLRTRSLRRSRARRRASAGAPETRFYRMPPLDLPVFLFRATDHRWRNRCFPALGWSRIDFPQLTVVPIPGTHTSLWQPQHAPALARKILTVWPSASTPLPASR